MAWPPTPSDLLKSLYKHQDWMSVYDPQHVAPLYADDLAEPRVINLGPGTPSWGTRTILTDKGKEAAEMLMGIRTESRFRQPNWLLQEITSVRTSTPT